MLVIVGGDGTVHDVAQGVMQRPRQERPVMAVVSVGSGNDYARTLGMPRDVAGILAQLKGAAVMPVDVGRCAILDASLPGASQEVFFLETMSFGVDAAVALRTVELRRATHAKGLRLYAHAAVSAIIAELADFHAVFTIDGVSYEDDLLIFAIQNGPTYGSGFRVAPKALADDGVLDVCVSRRIGTMRALHALSRMKAGTHEALPSFQTWRARGLEVAIDRDLSIQCDGERISGRRFKIDIVPGALDMLAATGGSAALRGQAI
jgi:YegS/Rv2252/BmrU family lipid kinase